MHHSPSSTNNITVVGVDQAVRSLIEKKLSQCVGVAGAAVVALPKIRAREAGGGRN
jgi:hypothetical protein